MPWPDVSEATKSSTGGINLKKLVGALKPVFETSVRRHSLPLRYHGSLLELPAPDRARSERLQARTPEIHGLKLNLEDGHPADVALPAYCPGS